MIEDWWLKLIALFAGVFIWVFAKLELEYTRQVKIALDFSLLPREYVVVESEVDSIVVEVKAKGRHLLNMWRFKRKDTDPRIIVPLGKAKEGEERIRIGPENVELPEEIRVLALNPYQVDLRIERRADRRVPVIVKPEGLPAKGFAAYDFTHERDVLIYGSQEDVHSITQLFAEPLNIEGVAGIKDTSVILERYLAVEIPEDVNLFVEPSSLLVRFTVEPKAEKVLDDIPVRLKGTPPRGQVYLSDEKVKLTLEGPRSLIEGLSKDEVQVTVSVSALDTGRHKVPGVFSLPPAIQLKNAEPESFNIRVR